MFSISAERWIFENSLIDILQGRSNATKTRGTFRGGIVLNKSRRCGDIFFLERITLGICQDSPPRAYEDLELSFPPGQGYYLNWQPRHFEAETAAIDDEATRSVDIDRNSKPLWFNFARSSKVCFLGAA